MGRHRDGEWVAGPDRAGVRRSSVVSLGLLVVLLAGLLHLPAGADHTSGGLAPFDGAVNVVPEAPRGVGFCMPFSNNVMFGFSGFIYRDVPAFELRPGSRVAFDLGGMNGVDVRRKIYVALGEPSADGDVRARDWTRIVSESQVPEAPRGNEVVGDYELAYTVEAPFEFPGGWLVVGFAGAPEVGYPDMGCEPVLVHTTASDPSGNFHARFWRKPHLTTDNLTNGLWSTSGIGGVVFFPDLERTVRVDVTPGSDRNPLSAAKRGTVPVAVLSEPDFDATTVDPGTVRMGVTGEEESVARCAGPEDVDGDGLDDLVCHARVADLGLEDASLEVVVTGTADGEDVRGTDAVTLVGRASPPGRS